MVKGSRNSVENVALFALPQKRNRYACIFLFHGNMLAPYRKTEMLESLYILFWDTENL